MSYSICRRICDRQFMGTTVRRSALELFFSAVSSDKVRKPFFCNWLRRWRVRFIQIRIKTVYFNSKGAYGLRSCRKSKFNARCAYRFGYVCNVLSDSSIGRVLVIKTVNGQSVYASGGLSAAFFLLSSSDCRRRRVLADK